MSDVGFLPTRWLDAFAFGVRVLAGGDSPWETPSQMGPFLRELDGYLDLPLMQLDVEDALDAVAPTASGNAETRLLDSPLAGTLTQAIASVSGAGLTRPLVLAVPGPGSLAAASGDDPNDDTIDDVAIALVDLLREVFVPEIAAVALDETTPRAVEFLGPLRNLSAHYDVPLVLRAPGDVLQQAGAVPGDTVYARVSPDMLLDGPAGERLYAKLPRDADPDMVLARIARLRAA